MSKPFGKTKTFAAIVFAVAAIVVASGYKVSEAYVAAEREADLREVQLAAEPTRATIKDASVQFISDCAGMDLSVPGVYLVGVSECLGRVRGLVDGHNMTVAMGKMMSAKNAELQLWCIGADVAAEEMLDEVMDWVDADPKRYRDILETTDGNNGSMIATVKALREAYPCINS